MVQLRATRKENIFIQSSFIVREHLKIELLYKHAFINSSKFKAETIWFSFGFLLHGGMCPVAITEYRISTNIFCGNYFFLNLEIVENLNSCRKFQFCT